MPAPLDLHGFLEGLDSFDALAAVELSRADRYKASLSLLLVEWNATKLPARRESEEQRGQHLRQLAQLVQENFRVSDRLGRWGDKGLAVLLPETGLQSAERVACRLLEAGRKDIILSAARLSIGVASHRAGEPLDLLVARAEMALVQAQKAKCSQALANLEDLEQECLVSSQASCADLLSEEARPPAALGEPGRLRLSRLMVQIAAHEADGVVPSSFLTELLGLLAAYLEVEEKELESARRRGGQEAAYHVLQAKVGHLLDEAGLSCGLATQEQGDETGPGSSRRFQDDRKYFGSSKHPRR